MDNTAATINTINTAQTTPNIHPAAHIGHVHYTVANLAQQVAFYRDILGFKVHWHDGTSAGLGAGDTDLLRLTEQPGARQIRGTTGLYHTAFLVPTRRDLAHLLKSIAETRTPIQGMTNHGTHLAIYLPDAEENGIELAWDFPRTDWPATIDEMMQRNRRLHPREVLSALEDDAPAWGGLPAGTQVGHVHLHVADLAATDRFYRETLGFGKPMDFGIDSAMFFAAGDYHHHIGTNVWQGIGAPPPPPDATGLRYYTVVLPDATARDQIVAQLAKAGISVAQNEEGLLIRDPAQNGIVMVVSRDS
jgi:catechol 2,3-dioxygenase